MLTISTISRPRPRHFASIPCIQVRPLTVSSEKLRLLQRSVNVKKPDPVETHPEPFLSNNRWKKITPGGWSVNPMKSQLQFLTTPTSDTTGTSILLHFDSKRYLIGSLAEGTQRATVEEGVKTQKISEIFISGRTEWSNVGGLLGFILTVSDVISSAASSAAESMRNKIAGQKDEKRKKEMLESEKKKLEAARQRMTIFGPANLNYVLATARKFIFRTGMPLAANEIPRMVDTRPATEDGPVVYAYQDENIHVWGLAVSPESSPPRNDRKRSHDSMEGVETAAKTSDHSSYDVASSIVNQMFNSDWSMDRLHECSINEVKLPAKIFVRDQETKEIKPYTGPLPSEDKPVPDVRVLVRTPWPAAISTPRLPAPTPSQRSVSYIVRTWPQRGKFDPKKALAFGLTDKSKYNVLAKGGSLVNDKGEEITSDMVLGATREGTGLFFVDLPTDDYVRPFLAQYAQLSESKLKNLGLYIWVLGKGVAAHPDLVSFINGKTDTEHVVTSPDVCPDRVSFDGAAGATIRLAAIDPVRFKAPVVRDTPAVSFGGSVTIGDRGLVYNLEPTPGLSKKDIRGPLRLEEALEPLTEETKASAEQARKDIEADKEALAAWAQSVPDSEAEIIPLGTGSALPSKYRNVSSTLIKIPGWGNLMLDAGEDTVGQLRRVFGEDEYKETMRDLRAIWISHLHADHHLGTASVCKEWYKYRHNGQPGPPASSDTDENSLISAEGRLSVISGGPMLHWLWEYSQVEDIGFSHINPLVVNPRLPKRQIPTSMHWFDQHVGDKRYTTPSIAAEAIGFSEVEAVFVKHCNGALAGALTLPSGFKVAYSGDCRPSMDFAAIGRGATVCIHEATFDDELVSDARAKNHSTTSEALGVASAMHARAALLTHFSQRYAKVPVLEYDDEEVGGDGDRLRVERGMKVAVAFDYMRVKVGELAQMEKFVPALLALYDSGEEAGEKQRGLSSARVIKAKKADA